jgi:hypothetical protein
MKSAKDVRAVARMIERKPASPAPYVASNPATNTQTTAAAQAVKRHPRRNDTPPVVAATELISFVSSGPRAGAKLGAGRDMKIHSARRRSKTSLG